MWDDSSTTTQPAAAGRLQQWPRASASPPGSYHDDSTSRGGRPVVYVGPWRSSRAIACFIAIVRCLGLRWRRRRTRAGRTRLCARPWCSTAASSLCAVGWWTCEWDSRSPCSAGKKKCFYELKKKKRKTISNRCFQITREYNHGCGRDVVVKSRTTTRTHLDSSRRTRKLKGWPLFPPYISRFRRTHRGWSMPRSCCVCSLFLWLNFIVRFVVFIYFWLIFCYYTW